ncbi:Flagellar hook-length control protein FliK [[Lactobacillus] rogosae]|nr:Flagellar hook-length control protein FliK [Lactobacillus rogosae]
MVSPAVVGTGSTNKVSGTAQTKASAKKSGDFKSVMADSLANGATNGNIGKTNIKDNLINVQNTNTNKISAKNNTSEDKSSVTGSAENADTSSISDVNSKADNKDVTDTVKEVCEDIKDAIKEEFDVSDEDIKVAMELLGLTALDLLSTAKVAELIEQLTGTDALTLITNEDMMQSFNNIINVVDEANADIAGMLGVKTEEVGIVLGQNDIAPVVNSEDTAKQDNVKESDAKNADDNINQTVDNQESLSEVLAKKITTESDGKAKNNMSESNEANNKVTYADVADNMISNITDTFADIITEDISTVKEADIVNQVIDSVKLMASRELTSMEVMLNPEHLGSVHITVTARNGIVSAQIAAQNEQVKTALENQMVTLREQFESQGLKVDAVEITVMAHSFEAGQNFGQSESERKQGESKVHRKLDLSSFDDELEEDLESTAPAPKAEGSSVEYLA